MSSGDSYNRHTALAIEHRLSIGRITGVNLSKNHGSLSEIQRVRDSLSPSFQPTIFPSSNKISNVSIKATLHPPSNEVEHFEDITDSLSDDQSENRYSEHSEDNKEGEKREDVMDTGPSGECEDSESQISMDELAQCKYPSCDTCCPAVLTVPWWNIRVLLTYLYVILMIYAGPFLMYWFEFNLTSIAIPYWISVSSILLTNLMIMLEMLLAWYLKLFRSSYLSRPIPDGKHYPKRVMCIIAAYLPNEIHTLIGPIRAMIGMNIPDGVKLTVMVAHNRGSQSDLNKLIRLIRQLRNELKDNVELRHLNVTQSGSKAENINAALEYAQVSGLNPEVIGIFDADHHPHPDNMERALKTLLIEDADVVQGRNCVGRGYRFIAIEFDIMYCVYHPGGAMLRGFGIFGGSNGYWRAEVLNRIGMDKNMLTEDVDSAMRALRRQHKVIYNRYMVSVEEAPPTFMDLIKQRLRWTQGWSEVMLRHAIPLMFGKGFGCGCCHYPERYQHHTSGRKIVDWFGGLRRRIAIFFFLLWREIYYYLAAQALPAGVVGLIKCTGDGCVEEGLIVLTVVLFIFPVLNSVIAYFITGEHRHPDLSIQFYLLYALLSMPYELLKFHLSILGHARNMLGLTKWRVTKRSIKEPVPDDEITGTRHREITMDLEVDIGTDWHGEMAARDGSLHLPSSGVRFSKFGAIASDPSTMMADRIEKDLQALQDTES
jgi:cellulose synthase/poly-beta-1,6-N-acetylglucosamine synthase-like glycosyltransferase